MLADLHSITDGTEWVEYTYEGRVIDIPVDDLCPDCISPRIEIGEVLGHFEAVSVEHSETCIHYRRRRDAAVKLYAAMPLGKNLTTERVKEILEEYPGYRNDAMRDLIRSGHVVRGLGKTFRRIR